MKFKAPLTVIPFLLFLFSCSTDKATSTSPDRTKDTLVVIKKGRPHLLMYRYRTDCDVPPRKLFRALKTVLKFDFSFGIKFDALFIDAC